MLVCVCAQSNIEPHNSKRNIGTMSLRVYDICSTCFAYCIWGWVKA